MQSIQSDYSAVLERLASSEPVLQVAEALTRSASVSVKTLVGSSRAAVVAALWSVGSMPFLVLTSDDKDVDDIVHDLVAFIGSDKVAGIREPFVIARLPRAV